MGGGGWIITDNTITGNGLPGVDTSGIRISNPIDPNAANYTGNISTTANLAIRGTVT